MEKVWLVEIQLRCKLKNKLWFFENITWFFAACIWNIMIKTAISRQLWHSIAVLRIIQNPEKEYKHWEISYRNLYIPLSLIKEYKEDNAFDIHYKQARKVVDESNILFYDNTYNALSNHLKFIHYIINRIENAHEEYSKFSTISKNSSNEKINDFVNNGTQELFSKLIEWYDYYDTFHDLLDKLITLSLK